MLNIKINKALFFKINGASILFSYQGNLDLKIKNEMTKELYNHLECLCFKLDDSSHSKSNLMSTLMSNSKEFLLVTLTENIDTVSISGPGFFEVADTKTFKLIYL